MTKVEFRQTLLALVRENPDITDWELVPLCPRKYAHDNLNATRIRQQLHTMMLQGKLMRTSIHPSRWRVRDDSE